MKYSFIGGMKHSFVPSRLQLIRIVFCSKSEVLPDKSFSVIYKGLEKRIYAFYFKVLSYILSSLSGHSKNIFLNTSSYRQKCVQNHLCLTGMIQKNYISYSITGIVPSCLFFSIQYVIVTLNSSTFLLRTT